MIDFDPKLLRAAGIPTAEPYQNGPSWGDSRSRSLKEEESGRYESKLIRVWEMPEPEARQYVVAGLVPDGALTIFYGDGGVGKSYIALHLAMCTALGLPIAGHPVERRNALYIDAELDQNEFLRRAYAMARGFGRERPPEGLSYWHAPGSLNNAKVRAQALAHVRECDARLTIIDSLTVGSYGIDPKEARDIIGLLKGLEEFGTVLAIDHIRTPEPGADTSDYRPFGSAFKHHLARSLLMVTKAANGAIAIRNTKANFGPKSAPLYLTLNFENESRVELEWLEPGDERLAAMTGIPAEERVSQALARSEGGISTPQAIAKELGLNPKTVSNHLTALRDKGRVEPLGDGRWRFLPDPPF